jgi:hypothetical protein
MRTHRRRRVGLSLAAADEQGALIGKRVARYRDRHYFRPQRGHEWGRWRAIVQRTISVPSIPSAWWFPTGQ